MTDIALTAAKIGAVDPQKADILTFIAAEAITKGQAVYQTTSGTVGVADANVANKQQARGIALEAAAAGQAVSVLRQGLMYGFTLSDQSYDDPVYLTDTAGAVGDANGTLTVPVGLVVALPDKDLTKVIYFDFRYGADWS